jgi:glycosyltransferase involved in cell wall biosynthesis
MNNFLSIVWYRVLPPAYGGQKGIAHFNHFLGNKVRLSCLCSRNNVRDDKLSYEIINELPVSKFQFWNPLTRKQILSFIREGSFTHIIIEHPWHGWLGKYRKEYNFKLIVHAHNIEHLRMKAKNKWWWRVLKKTERNAFLSADHILFKTEKDRETATRLFHISAQKGHIVPYGILEMEQPFIDNSLRERLRKKYNITPGDKILLFAGTLDYEPNVQAIEMITGHIIPLLQKKDFHFRVIICGALDEKRTIRLNGHGNITVTGFIDPIQEYMQWADVFINPVTTGSGIQTKTIEAIANGCNVVSTSFAATGVSGYLINKKVFVSADNDWDAFANNIILAASQSALVPPQFYTDHNWQNTIDGLLQVITTGE